MSETKNITVPEINKTVEQMLIKGDGWMHLISGLIIQIR